MARRAAPHKEAAPVGAPEWMLTFADAMSLLLTFFVLLLTFSTKNREDFDNVAGSLRGALGPMPADRELDNLPSLIDNRIAVAGRATLAGPTGPPELGPMPFENLSNSMRLKRRLAGTPITASSSRKGFVLTLPSAELFDGTTARLTDRGRRDLDKIANTIRYVPNDIEVAAYTDSESTAAPGDKAQIALSLAQGLAVVHQLLHSRYESDWNTTIASDRVGLQVPGDSSPQVSRTGPAAAEKNRRVEITLLKFAR